MAQVPTGMVGHDHYYNRIFYPGVESRAKAKAIQVAVGKEVTGVDFAVGASLKAFTVSGRVVDASTGEPIHNCQLEVVHKADSGSSEGYAGSADGASDTDSDGKFKISGFLSGQFLIKPRFDDGSNFYCDPVKVEVKGQDVSGIEIKARQAVTISGSISIEGDYPAGAVAGLPASGIAAGWVPEGGFVPQPRESVVNPDGTFEIKGIRPGEVQIFIPQRNTQSRFLSLVRVEYADESGQKKVALGENQFQNLARSVKQTGQPVGPAAPAGPVVPAVLAPPASAGGQSPASTPDPVPSPVEDQTAGASRITMTSLPLSGSFGQAAVAPGGTAALIQAQLERLIPGAIVTASVEAGRDLTGIQVVLSYDNAIIRGHVNVAGRSPAAKAVILAQASSRGQHVGAARVDENGDYSIEGLKPGDYTVTIHVFERNGASGRNVSKTLPASVGKNAVTKLSFDIDLNAKPDDR